MQHRRKWVIALSSILLIGSAVTMQFVLPHAEAASTKGSVAWPRWTTVGTKIVPIVSVGSPGVRLGLAQVSGPKKQAQRVRAVMQIDGDFNIARAKILVPSDSYTSLRRVQGTAVTALIQYKLLDFTKKKAAPAKVIPVNKTPVIVTPVKRNPAKVIEVKPPTRTIIITKPAHHDNGKHLGWYKQSKKHQRSHDKHNGKHHD